MGGSTTTKFLKEVLRADSKRLCRSSSRLSPPLFSPLYLPCHSSFTACESLTPNLFTRYLARESFDLGCFTPFNTITSRCEFASRSTSRCCKACSILPNGNGALEFILVMGQFHESLVIYENFLRQS